MDGPYSGSDSVPSLPPTTSSDPTRNDTQCTADRSAQSNLSLHPHIVLPSIYTWLASRARGFQALFFLPISTAHKALRAFRPRLTSANLLVERMPCDTAQTQADHELISKLVELASVEQKKQRCVNSTTYKVPVGEEVVQVQSWRMREHDYYKPNPPFPTRSRGLFTVTDEKTEKHMVVARGYDKFYNIGEVPWTAVSCAFGFPSIHGH